MRRVYVLWVMKSLTSPIVLKSAIIFALVWQGRGYVSFSDVVLNSPFVNTLSDGTMYQFFMNAALHADAVMYALTAAALGVGAWLVRDIVAVRRHAQTFAV